MIHSPYSQIRYRPLEGGIFLAVSRALLLTKEYFVKNLTFVTALLVGLGATTAQAKTECKVQSDSISTIEIQQDGGEENLTLTSTSGQKARLLVLRNHGGVTVAIVD